MTPRELGLQLEEYNERKQREYEEKITLNYLSERLHRMGRLPSLKEVLDKVKPKKPLEPQSDEQMFAAVMGIHKSFD